LKSVKHIICLLHKLANTTSESSTDDYVTQEYQGTMGSKSQWKYAIITCLKGGDLQNTHDMEGAAYGKNTGVSIPQCGMF